MDQHDVSPTKASYVVLLKQWKDMRTIRPWREHWLVWGTKTLL